jgi:hypothetical protein
VLEPVLELGLELVLVQERELVLVREPLRHNQQQQRC